MPTGRKTANAVVKKNQVVSETANAHIGQPYAKLAFFHSHYHLLDQIEMVDLATEPELSFSQHTHDRSQVSSVNLGPGKVVGIHRHHARQVGLTP